VTLTSDELGVYPYTVRWQASPPGKERTLVLKAPLGGSVMENFKFIHYAQRSVTYDVMIMPVPGHRGPATDFVLDIKEITRPAAPPDDGLESSVAVRFQPSVLGECRAILLIKGQNGSGGAYEALLTGYAQPPQPQGPIVIPSGGKNTVDFRNPFSEDVEFTLQVDNMNFSVQHNTQVIKAGQKEAIQVSFSKCDRGQGGRLSLSCEKVSTPWVFFLKGEI